MTESGVRLIETPGGRVFVSDADQGSVARALRNKGRYEKDWTAWMRAHVGPGMQLAPIDASAIEERAAALGTWSSFNLLWVK